MRREVFKPLGMDFVRLGVALARAGRDQGSRGDALRLAEATWGVSSPAAQILKSAMSGASLTDTSWASALAPYAQAAAEFVEALRPLTIIGKMATSMRHAPLQTKVPRATVGSTVSWVGSGSPTPISSMALDSITLAALKVAGIIIITRELAQLADPAAERLIREDLLAAVATFQDVTFIDPTLAGVTGVSPASITFGAPSVAATGTTIAAVRADLRALFRLLTDAGINLTAPFLVMDRRTAIALCLMDDAGSGAFAQLTVNGGFLCGVPVITTGAVPSPVTADSPPVAASNIILVDAAEIIIADTDGIAIDISAQGSVQMNTAPDSPVTAATVQVSLWQQNLIGFRVVRPINWAIRRPGAAAVLTGCNY